MSAARPHRTMASNRARPIITLEEHFLSAAALGQPTLGRFTAKLKDRPGFFENYVDLGASRLASMDAGEVTMQIVSHGAGELPADLCRAANDQLADAIRANPLRLAGFAFLPVTDPEASAVELRRTCAPSGMDSSSLGLGTQGGARASGAGATGSSGPSAAGPVRFVGALIDNHTAAGRYYDSPDYDVLWAAAVELDVPIYLHPAWPADDLYKSAYKSEALPEAASDSIASAGFGWHSDVATHVLRLFAAGVFDRFPKLKVVIGHFGEMIPFMLQRIERISSTWGKRTRSFRQVWDENIWITTSGVWSLDPLVCTLKNTKLERILYSVDYPFASNENGLQWLQELESSGLVSEEDLDGIRWKNAARLLKLDIKAD